MNETITAETEDIGDVQRSNVKEVQKAEDRRQMGSGKLVLGVMWLLDKRCDK